MSLPPRSEAMKPNPFIALYHLTVPDSSTVAPAGGYMGRSGRARRGCSCCAVLRLKRVFLPISIVLAPAMLALSFAQGWLVLPLAAAVAARIFSVRFFVGFLGSAAAAPVVSIFYERTGSVAAVTTVLAVFSVVTLGCALFFPNRKEELEPELWADALT